MENKRFRIANIRNEMIFELLFSQIQSREYVMLGGMEIGLIQTKMEHSITVQISRESSYQTT